MQQVVDDALPAHRYFSDGLPIYAQLLYPGTHTVAEGKSQTYSVEGDNAELRHYLARLDLARLDLARLDLARLDLARLNRRSRRFSRCIRALQRAVALFVYAWNRRQTFKREFPKAPAFVCDFVADLI